MSDEAARKSQDGAAGGHYLTSEEREALEAVYHRRDEVDPALLREAATGASSYSVRPGGLSAADRSVVATLKRHVTEIGRPVDFRVVGSRVRGDATGESDLDVFIELDTATDATRRRTIRNQQSAIRNLSKCPSPCYTR